MNSIGLALSALTGCALGLGLLDRSPAGLDVRYGWALLAFALACLLPAVISHGNRRAFWSALMLAALLAGCGRALLIHTPATQADLAFYNADPDPSVQSLTVAITGVITGEPRQADRSQTLRISARAIKLPGKIDPISISGEMFAVVPRFPVYSIGESLTLSGRIAAPPTFEGFDYAAYLARRGVYSYMTFPQVASLGRGDDEGIASLLAATRSRARHTLQSTIAEPEASIAVGVVMGDRSTMSDAAKAAFLNSGTSHILAISGQNISLLIGILFLAYSRGNKQQQRMATWLALSTLTMVAAYTAFTGASPSVVRAAIMGGALLLGPVVGRRYDPAASLAVSAAIMVCLDPYLLADAGFQLSFAAMMGVVFVSPLLFPLLGLLRLPDFLAYPISGGIGAVAATMPLGALISGKVSVVAPLATLTADFALLPLMISGIATAILGVFSDLAALAALPAALAWLSSWFLLSNAQLWSSLPFAAFPVEDINVAYIVAYYAILASSLLLATNPALRGRIAARRPHMGLGIGLMSVVAVAVWAAALVLLLR